MKSLRLTLLGGFQVRNAAGRKILIAGTKATLLLAYLALRPGEPHSRDKLMALLWSDRGEKQARGSLRQAIWALRRAFEGIVPCPLVVEGDSLFLDPGAIETDVNRLEQLVAEGSADALQSAAMLCSGQLLAGLRVKDAAFEAFLNGEQARLHDLVVNAFARRLEGRPSRPSDETIAATAMGLLELDPLQEVAHRALIRHYAGKGQVGLAVRQFQTCCQVLREELDVGPSPETEALIDDVRQGRPCGPAGPELSGETPAERSPAEENLAGGPPPVPQEKPSIAVLPFLNLSGDPDQEVFSDGITEDIITALSRLRWFLVIARHSSFVYKGRSVDIKQVGRELGVRYVLEGSVRKSGNRLRITAQLIDAASGVQHWAQSYDRELTDIFELQDDITRSVTAAIEPKLLAIEGIRAQTRSPEDLGAWELVTRAMTHCGRMTTEA